METLENGSRTADGSVITEHTRCPSLSTKFGQLPSVQQTSRNYTMSGKFAGRDCYLVGEARIKAGMLSDVACIVSPANSTSHSATCSSSRVGTAPKANWLTNPTLDFMPDTIKYATMLNFTSSYMKSGPSDYANEMLTLAYHATWSAMRERWDFGAEPLKVQVLENVVEATINRSRLIVWLLMNASLWVAASLVWVYLAISHVPAIRDPTLAALTIDLGEVSHDKRANGLCGAMELDKNDKKLGKLMWKGETGERGCGRAVTLVKEKDTDMERLL